MRLLLIGGGGREHALAWALARSPKLKLFCAPGNAGTARLAENIPIKAEEIQRLVEFAQANEIDLTIVGPEQPIALGIYDAFSQAGLRIAAPSQRAAFLEASKAQAKEFMSKYEIPTARYGIYDDYQRARASLSEFGLPLVIKADGLAAGKGVIIAPTRAEAEQTLQQFLVERRFGQASRRVVLEEYLTGREFSLFVASDGQSWCYLGTAQDYKRRGEGDRGPNTGGMGAVSPVPWLSEAMLNQAQQRIVQPTFDSLAREGIRYQGILYFGLVWTEGGPQLLEYNVRFGDPETQTLVPRFDFDLLELFQRIVEGRLAGLTCRLKPKTAVCVVAVSQGYPGSYEMGKPISGLEDQIEQPDLFIFHAGTARSDGRLVSAGGRVLSTVGVAAGLAEARAKAYRTLAKISYAGMGYRRDIGN